jgi:uncharacterized protein YbjT (DUF2867 family)
MMTLAGKTAVVTGGSRGIGRAIVRRLAADGARVVFSFRDDKAAADALAGETGDAVAVRADQEDLVSLTPWPQASGRGRWQAGSAPREARDGEDPEHHEDRRRPGQRQSDVVAGAVVEQRLPA